MSPEVRSSIATTAHLVDRVQDVLVDLENATDEALMALTAWGADVTWIVRPA